MWLTCSRAQTHSVFPRWRASATDRHVEVSVIEREDLRRLHPRLAELTIVELNSRSALVAYPFLDNGVDP